MLMLVMDVLKMTMMMWLFIVAIAVAQ